MNGEWFLLYWVMIATFQGQLELREIAIMSNKIFITQEDGVCNGVQKHSDKCDTVP